MSKIGYCLSYEITPLSQMVDLRILPPTSKLHSTYYESDKRLFPWTDEKKLKTYILYVMSYDEEI